MTYLTNVRDPKTNTTICVIAGGRVQHINPYTLLANALVIEFADAIYLEEFMEDDMRSKAARRDEE